MSKKGFLIILMILTMLACKKSATFKVEGKITNSQSKMIYLEKLELKGPVPYDSTRIDQQGHFKLKGKVSYPTFFLLKLNEKKFITLLLDSAEQVTFSADYLNFSSDYKIEGSFGSAKVQELNRQFAATISRIDSINALITLSQNDLNYQNKLKAWELEKDGICRAQSEFSKNFILQNPFSLASILAIYQRFNDQSYVVQDLQTIKTAASALNTMYPRSDHVKALYEDTKKMMQNMNNLQMRKLIEDYGRNSPEIVLPDADGKMVALSSLEGKYVLLHFWSANDRGSRIMNPVLKENYTKFKSKRFEIYQVSVDTVRQDWIKAIQEDQLTWTNVGDMAGSFTAVSHYNVNSLPFNYLLDPEGRIIARDLKGPALRAKLSEILN